MLKSARMNIIEYRLPIMSKWRMSQIVAQCNGFRQVFIQVQTAGNGPRNLRYFNGVSQTCPEMVPFRSQENLCLMHETAECFGMNNPVPVSLKLSTHFARFFRITASPRICTFHCLFGQNIIFSFFQFFSQEHWQPSFSDPVISRRYCRSRRHLFPFH